MAFLKLFKSKAERDFELKSKLRQAYHKIEQHVRKLDTQRQKYLGLARKAFELRDMTQFADFARRYHHTQVVSNRWQKYQLKLSAMDIQRDEVQATEEFLSGIGALTQAILRGVKPEEVQRVARDIEMAEERCVELEQTMEEQMRDVLQPLSSGAALDEATLTQLVGADDTDIDVLTASPLSNLSEKSQPTLSSTSKLSFEEALRCFQVSE